MTDLEVSTHSGDADKITATDYNALDMIELLNDNEVHSILIGENIYSRIDIKNIKVISHDA